VTLSADEEHGMWDIDEIFVITLRRTTLWKDILPWIAWDAFSRIVAPHRNARHRPPRPRTP
jgi:hypothetical protein